MVSWINAKGFTWSMQIQDLQSLTSAIHVALYLYYTLLKKPKCSPHTIFCVTAALSWDISTSLSCLPICGKVSAAFFQISHMSTVSFSYFSFSPAISSRSDLLFLILSLLVCTIQEAGFRKTLSMLLYRARDQCQAVFPPIHTRWCSMSVFTKTYS